MLSCDFIAASRRVKTLFLSWILSFWLKRIWKSLNLQDFMICSRHYLHLSPQSRKTDSGNFSNFEKQKIYTEAQHCSPRVGLLSRVPLPTSSSLQLVQNSCADLIRSKRIGNIYIYMQIISKPGAQMWRWFPIYFHLKYIWTFIQLKAAKWRSYPLENGVKSLCQTIKMKHI